MKTSAIDYQAFRAALPKGSQMYIPDSILARWTPEIMAKADEDVATISILDVIGADFWGEGVTPGRIAGALRSIGEKKPVIVNVNSPGGDMFDGIAIHNMLAEHKGHVTVKVLGLAASAASVIAMAGDEIQIAKSAFYMVHNSWIVGMGDRHDFQALAKYLEPFDHAMRDLYSDRTGVDPETVEGWLDTETWFGSNDAIENGLADSTLTDDPEVSDEPTEESASAALRKIDAAMAKGGLARSKRRELLNTLRDATPSAGDDDDNTPSAVQSVEKVETMLSTINQIRGLMK